MSKKRILVVDDEPAIQLLYGAEFSDEGFNVDKALNGEEALAIFKEVLPDLVILDINMPGMNGIEVLRRMKADQPGLPIILNSAYQEFKQNLGAWASDAYVVKSSNMEELKEMVKKLLI